MNAAPATTPISSNDRVSDVLARDEALIEIFVRHAPHFAKLRNRAMRHVMARLITVEQAARTANVSAERLVNDLNAALGIVCPAANASGISDDAPHSARDESRRHPIDVPVVELDVRDDLRSGREPFSRIMRAVSTLREQDVLHLRATFEPVPLFTVLGKRGFVSESQCHAADDWSVWFWRSGEHDAAATADRRAETSGNLPESDELTTYLDVRGLEPPEPMMRTLGALESLAQGHTLLQVNSRVPQFLLPLLVERGFTYEMETQDDRVLLRITHAS